MAGGRRKKCSQRFMRDLAANAPRNEKQLRAWVEKVLGMTLPARALVRGHQMPLDYLVHAYTEGGGHWPGSLGREQQESGEGGTADCVVWANRGGGKTRLGAAATVLDLVYKPGIQIRILGGSLEQSSRMYIYLKQMFEHPWLKELLACPPTQRRVDLTTGSAVEILAQTQCSVRGTRVHKLRCDEVDEFHPEIWEAAQLVTRSDYCGSWWVKGTVEALSTMHRPHGLMHQLVQQAAGKAKVFRWSVLDVMEKCQAKTPCASCQVEALCQGRARTAAGFFRWEDFWNQRARVGDRMWEVEMLCAQPIAKSGVFPELNLARHVGATAGGGGGILVGGMDFGVRNPCAFVWARVHGNRHEPVQNWAVEVLDDYQASNLTTEQNIRAIRERGWPMPAWIGVDPAGGQRNAQTGISDIQLLQRLGFKVRAQRSGLGAGINRIRARLDHELLRFDPRCQKLIEAMATYHYDPRNPRSEVPVKDGPDHLCDALRYLIMNLEMTTDGKTDMAKY